MSVEMGGRERSLVGVVEERGFYLSDTERLFCEVMAETGDFNRCREAIVGKYGRKVSVQTLKRWMGSREHVKEEVKRLVVEKGKARMSREEWKGMMVSIVRGDRRLNSTTPYMFKLIGEANGWFEENKSPAMVFKDVRINILQSNGKA